MSHTVPPDQVAVVMRAAVIFERSATSQSLIKEVEDEGRKMTLSLFALSCRVTLICRNPC